MANADLGLFSTQLLWGEEATAKIASTRQSRKKPDIVVCTEVPPGWEEEEDAGRIQEPYVLVADRKHPRNLLRINCSEDEASANTRINENGTVTVLTASANEELLAWYGNEYAKQIFGPLPPKAKVPRCQVRCHIK